MKKINKILIGILVIILLSSVCFVIDKKYHNSIIGSRTDLGVSFWGDIIGDITKQVDLTAYIASSSPSVDLSGYLSTTTAASTYYSQTNPSGYISSTSSETLTNKILTAPKILNGGFIADDNGNELIKFATTASAVNEITIRNANNINSPTIEATGDSPNIGIRFVVKGSGGVEGRFIPRTAVYTSVATPNINTNLYEGCVIRELATNILNFQIGGNPVNLQRFIIRIKDNGTARSISWGTANVKAAGAALPTTTVPNKWLTIEFLYNSITGNWDCIYVAQEA